MKHVSNITSICLFYLLLLVSITQSQADQIQDTALSTPPPNHRILDKWRGTWKVTAIYHPPDPKTLTYVDTFKWVLHGRFLQGESSEKSDGTKAMSMIWFDLFTQSYRFVIYDSTEPKPAEEAGEVPLPWGGIAVELPPPTWHEDTQTMEWDSGFFGPVKYTGRSRFVNDDMIISSGLLKDWKGTVIVDVETTSIRQHNAPNENACRCPQPQ